MLAALLYIYRISETTKVEHATPEYIEGSRAHILQDKQIPGYVTILRVHGPLLFGAAQKLVEETADLTLYNPVVILRLRNMTALDATGLHALETLSARLRASGKTLLLCGAPQQPAQLLKQAKFIEHVGEANICPHVEAALQRAREVHEGFDGLGEEEAEYQRTLAL